MKTTVIYHSADFDGIFCREIAKHFLGEKEVDYIGWNFGDRPLEVPKEGKVYVMDLPCDAPFGFKFPTNPVAETFTETSPGNAHKDFCNWVWIDHHKSAIESHPIDLPGYRIDGVAASRLAWQWFYRGYDGANKEQVVCENITGQLPLKEEFINRAVPEPLAVRLAGEYDIWDKRDPRAELFQFGLRSQSLDSLWDLLLVPEAHSEEKSDIGTVTVEALLDAGESIKYARDQEYKDVILSQGFDLWFEDLCFLACNSHECDIRSHLFEAGITDNHNALLGFTYNGKNKLWQVSMYHAPKWTDIDLSLIAKKYGGGGHKGACGFTCKTLPFPLCP